MIFSSFSRVLFLLLLLINPANALENLSIEVEQIKSNDWQLNNLSLSLSDLQNSSQQLSLLIKQITLPDPFSEIKIFDIQCSDFSWQENKIDCKTGRAKLISHIIHRNPFAFSFSLTEQKSRFSIKNLQLAKGTLSLTAKEQGEYWNVSIKTKNLRLKELYGYLSKKKKWLDEVSNGRVNADITARGNSHGLNTLLIDSLFEQVSLQAKQGKIAAEAVNLQWEVQAKLKNGEWQWQTSQHINQGELYLEPVYLKVNEKGLDLTASGLWQGKGSIQINKAQYIQPEVIELNSNGLITYQPLFNVEQANISGKINNADLFATQYVLPFTQQTAFEGFKFQGTLSAEIEIKQSAVTQVSAKVKSLSVNDDKKRVAINNAKGEINWSKDSASKVTSKVHWDQLKIRAIPIEAGQLKFLYRNKQVTLIEQTSISLLGGTLDVKQFDWLNTAGDEPQVYFEGGINQLSLEKLSYALDWTPLSGNISGYIPGVNYQNKTLTINSELKAQLFGGTITIDHLTSSGLFTDFSKFSMDMLIDNLDLNQITQKFEIGSMEGRVSGFINNLYLENWQPITFYAWLGTPENDDSRHRISQKAVENIASIGGGGAADVISKGFLRFFDNFSYDRIGFGCYLHQGVCQLMGVEAAEQGYYIIKGGGIPRIDIIGYNPQVDWNVLMERLSRIASTNDVVVK